MRSVLQKSNHTKITWGNVYLDFDKMSNVIDIVSNGVRLCRPKTFLRLQDKMNLDINFRFVFCLVLLSQNISHRYILGLMVKKYQRHSKSSNFVRGKACVRQAGICRNVKGIANNIAMLRCEQNDTPRCSSSEKLQQQNKLVSVFNMQRHGLFLLSL